MEDSHSYSDDELRRAADFIRQSDHQKRGGFRVTGADIAAWVTALSVIAGTYAYLTNFLHEQAMYFQAERASDEQWQREEDDNFKRIENVMMSRFAELREENKSLERSVATLRAEIAKDLGLHKGDHRILENIISEMDSSGLEETPYPGRHD